MFSINKYIAITIVSIIITGYQVTAKEIAVITKSKGLVKIQYKSQSSWQNVKSGFMVHSNAILHTGADGFAIIKYIDDNSIVKMRPKSELFVCGDIEKRSIIKKVIVNFGEALFEVSKKQKEFDVETPTSVASVKGTKFLIIVSRTNGSTAIYGIEGELTITGIDGKNVYKLKSKMKALCNSDGITIQPLTEKDIANLKLFLSCIEKNDTTMVIAHELSIGLTGKGSVIPDGKFIAIDNIPVDLTAKPDSGYAFIGWSIIEGVAYIENEHSAKTRILLNGSDADIQAYFSSNACAVSVLSSGEGTTSLFGDISVVKDSSVTVSAEPAEGFKFVKWHYSGDVDIEDEYSEVTTVHFSGDATVTAVFEPIFYNLNVLSGGNGTVSLPEGTKVQYGKSLKLSAVADEGFTFVGWEITSGSAQIEWPNNPETSIILVEGDVTVEARFAENVVSVTISTSEGGSVMPEGVTNMEVDREFTITAMADKGYTFDKWETSEGIVVSNSSSSTTTIKSQRDGSVTATFSVLMYQLTLSTDGNGSVTPSTSKEIQAEKPINISAIPKGNSKFIRWDVISGDADIVDNYNASTTVTLHSTDAYIQATFSTDRCVLSVESQGNGTVTPNGTVYTIADEAVALSAEPDKGYAFIQWSIISGLENIELTSMTSPLTYVTLSGGSATVQAVFSLEKATVSDQDTSILIVRSDGYGTVEPSGEIKMPRGSVINISAEPIAGYSFNSWIIKQGIARIGNSSLQSTTIALPSGDATVTACFIKKQSLEFDFFNNEQKRKTITIEFK